MPARSSLIARHQEHHTERRMCIDRRGIRLLRLLSGPPFRVRLDRVDDIAAVAFEFLVSLVVAPDDVPEHRDADTPPILGNDFGVAVARGQDGFDVAELHERSSGVFDRATMRRHQSLYWRARRED